MDNNVCEDSNVRDNIVKEATLADSLDEAEGYVSSVMGTQPIVPVLRTPITVLPNDRKRHLSLPAVSGTDHTKKRSDENDPSEVGEKCIWIVHIALKRLQSMIKMQQEIQRSSVRLQRRKKIL